MPRTVKDLGYQVSPDVVFTIELLTTQYGALPPRDSGHTKTAPTWIYECPGHGGAEVAVRMNKQSLTLYLRDRTRDGRYLSDILPAQSISKRYPADGKPAASVYNSMYLGPSENNQVLMVNLTRADVEPILSAYFGLIGNASGALAATTAAQAFAACVPLARGRKAVTAEEFQAQLDRRAEVGAMGEGLAVLHEMDRLRQCECAAPEHYVQRVALTDVGRGYDIESTWPGQERCIEVKTTTSSGSDFFITQNEWEVLAQLGAKAWIYRVVLDAAGSEQINAIGPDPISLLSMPSVHVSPVVWRVAEEAFEQE